MAHIQAHSVRVARYSPGEQDSTQASFAALSACGAAHTSHDSALAHDSQWPRHSVLALCDCKLIVPTGDLCWRWVFISKYDGSPGHSVLHWVILSKKDGVGTLR